MGRPSKYWEIAAKPAGNGMVYCTSCSDVVSLTASICPTCGSKEYFGSHKRRHAREEINDNTVIYTAIAALLFGIVHGIATSSGVFGAIFNATWQGTVGLLFGVPIGFAINIMRSFGRRGGLR
jgi:hypothetical protein